jgi:glucokinase
MIDAMPEGVGAGVYVNDRVRQGFQSLAGEVGHMVLEPHDGPECICGGRGCFESLVSVRNIRTMIAAEKGLSLLFRDADDMDDRAFVTRFFDACAEEEEHCLKILDGLAFWFALGFNNILMVNDPELIVIEGIYRDAGERFLRMIRTHMSGMGMPKVEKNTRIEFSSFGLERGVLGASVYSSVEFFNNLFQ